MHVLVGTSGYSYAPWKGIFYPEKLPAAKMLAYYATRLPTVEINNTFYRMPARETLERWAAETPPTFSFVLKSPKRITHDRRLLDVGESVKQFFAAAIALGDKCGPVLFQLPPFLKKDVPRLDAFLAQLREHAPAARAAFEFRHESWHADEVYASLKNHGAALCIADADDSSTPFEVTAPWGYLRLRRQDYDDAALATWAGQIREKGARWERAHVFFKHEDEGRGPQLAEKLIQLMA